MQYVLIIVLSLAGELMEEKRFYPFPNLAACEASKAAALREYDKQQGRYPRHVLKAVCEPMG